MFRTLLYFKILLQYVACLDRKTGNIIIPLRGGKGVVGRSGKNIILADIGLANLNACLGVHGRRPTIADFILSKVPSLENSPSRPRKESQPHERCRVHPAWPALPILLTVPEVLRPSFAARRACAGTEGRQVRLQR